MYKSSFPASIYDQRRGVTFRRQIMTGGSFSYRKNDRGRVLSVSLYVIIDLWLVSIRTAHLEWQWKYTFLEHITSFTLKMIK